MKAKTKLYLSDGTIIKVTHSLDDLKVNIAHAHKAGSAFEYDRITDHGTLKRTIIPVGMIVRLEEL